ncbi:hypothetical protein SEMRO_508_G156681.1 [Seminavis robusta]|uniref:Uncharacterized protein n=1 Tax=Seminavis robusta TaxID=568900 RepID=A0A9N8DZR1_9STRA|nr:hypothetical protein SEMRO_508_G156681.1 [Seminavis robusta]|eukprot:Sro508_g156681.1  (140) ;mRNA; r:18883-19521
MGSTFSLCLDPLRYFLNTWVLEKQYPRLEDLCSLLASLTTTPRTNSGYSNEYPIHPPFGISTSSGVSFDSRWFAMPTGNLDCVKGAMKRLPKKMPASGTAKKCESSVFTIAKDTESVVMVLECSGNLSQKEIHSALWTN